ncbi:MAG: hypothetical protein WCN81_04550, partial [Actinomycetes bacterium]
MDASTHWDGVLAALAERGWEARVVPVARLADLRERVERELSSGRLAASVAARIAADFGWEPATGALAPGGARPGGAARNGEAQKPAGRARSVVIGAKARPLTQAALTVGGERHVVVVPPH